MSVPFDLYKTLTIDHSAYFVQNKETVFLIQLEEGPIEILGKRLFFNVILWRPLLERKLPISAERHLFKGGLFDTSVIARINTAIYDDILEHCPQDSIKVRFEFMEGLNRLHIAITFELGEYHRSVDMLSISRTLQIPEIAAATRFEPDPNDNIQKVEALYKASADRLMAVVSSPEFRHNAFYPFIKLGSLNAAQFPQVIMAGGPRTDVDDTMFRKAILGSFARGFRDIVEYAIDSRQAAKSEWYNASTMGKAQYSNRKQQLLAIAVRHIYPGDCGTKVTVPFFINRRYAKMIVGKVICDDGGSLVELTRSNIHKYFDRRVNMRSPLTCLYQDGFCRVCGGRLVDYMPPGVVPGIAAEHEVMAPIAQRVLSNKHVAKTRATTYILPRLLRDQNIFEVDGNEIYLRPHVDISKLAIGMPFKTVERLGDLQHVKGDTIPNDQYFTDITQMALGDATTLEQLSPIIPMTDDNKNYPHLAGATLHMIREYPECLQVSGDLVWVRFDKFDRTRPVMYSTVVNDSTRVFVQKVEYLFTRQIQDFTSLGDVLHRFSEIVWKGDVFPHLMHLEVCIKANLITDDVDFSIPVVTDPDNVRFAPLAQIIPRRSIGPQIAFEMFNAYTTDPSTFIFPKSTSLFDGYMGFNDG